MNLWAITNSLSEELLISETAIFSRHRQLIKELNNMYLNLSYGYKAELKDKLKEYK